MDSYDDIRPYHDDEVVPVLNQLVRNSQLKDALGHFYYPNLPAFIRKMMRPVIGLRMRQAVSGVHNVATLQQSITPMVNQVIGKTTTDFTWSGLENLDPNKSFLLLSNHRDIVMDPALVNFALWKQGLKTSRIAIGDNLLGRPYVSDLMRLNKSFIVRRSVTGRREKLKALQKLSSYIAHSVRSGENVWIAHREGRAKDGDDRTDTAILKMLNMSFRSQKRSFDDLMTDLNIVPVCVSYEYDPCDTSKAVELQARAEEGGYNKEEDEDLRSIVTGIEGHKGRVHVAFGKPLAADGSLESPQVVASELDRQLHSLYKLRPSNWLARDLMAGESNMDDWHSRFDAADVSKHEQLFNERLQACPKAAREWFLKIYANPVLNQL